MLFSPNSHDIDSNYQQKGVTIQPAIPRAQTSATLKYDGLLARSGAHGVYAHVGFGANWSNTQDIRMSRTANGFTASIPVQYADTLNIAFKDCANNWDNNSGKNYSFDISL